LDYFHRRNRPTTEYSGHEEASSALRNRLGAIHDEYVRDTTAEGYFLRSDQLVFLCRQQLPDHLPKMVISNGEYDQVFTVVEVLHDYSRKLYEDRRARCRGQLAEAFRLSGSVYELKAGRVVLIASETTAKKLAEVEPVLSPYANCYTTFFGAVGDLMGRKRKADDIVKDLFIGAEAYLKAITGENDYGSSIKALGKVGALNTMQRAIMDKLHGYRSDAHGVGHAGNSPAPSETDALWFLETMLAQLTHIDRNANKSRN
jgi:hypothetical protein